MFSKSLNGLIDVPIGWFGDNEKVSLHGSVFIKTLFSLLGNFGFEFVEESFKSLLVGYGDKF